MQLGAGLKLHAIALIHAARYDNSPAKIACGCTSCSGVVNFHVKEKTVVNKRLSRSRINLPLSSALSHDYAFLADLVVHFHPSFLSGLIAGYRETRIHLASPNLLKYIPYSPPLSFWLCRRRSVAPRAREVIPTTSSTLGAPVPRCISFTASANRAQWCTHRSGFSSLYNRAGYYQFRVRPFVKVRSAKRTITLARRELAYKEQFYTSFIRVSAFKVLETGNWRLEWKRVSQSYRSIII